MNVRGNLVVSLHDVCPPHLENAKKILAHLTALGVNKRSLLVIPHFRGQWRIDENHELAEWLRGQETGGDEIVLHGYNHTGGQTPQGIRDKIKNRLYTTGQGEFLSLNYDEARRRIELGTAILRNINVKSVGFIAPAWLLSREGLAAVKDLGFDYTNFYMSFCDSAKGRSIFAPALVFGPGNFNEDWSLRFQRLFLGLLKRQPFVRVVIHPPCADHDRRFAQILAIIRELLLHLDPTTYKEFLAKWRAREANGR